MEWRACCFRTVASVPAFAPGVRRANHRGVSRNTVRVRRALRPDELPNQRHNEHAVAAGHQLLVVSDDGWGPTVGWARVPREAAGGLYAREAKCLPRSHHHEFPLHFRQCACCYGYALLSLARRRLLRLDGRSLRAKFWTPPRSARSGPTALIQAACRDRLTRRSRKRRSRQPCASFS